MPAVFDPYSELLGLAAGQRPPNYFQLLAVSANESRADVISSAATVQTEKLAQHLKGPHARFAKRLLVEIESAKNCLLDPIMRDAYVQATRSGGKPSLPSSVRPSAAAASSSDALSARGAEPVTRDAPSADREADESLLSDLLDEALAPARAEEQPVAIRPTYEPLSTRWEDEAAEEPAEWPSWILYTALILGGIIAGGVIYESLPSWGDGATGSPEDVALVAPPAPAPAAPVQAKALPAQMPQPPAPVHSRMNPGRPPTPYVQPIGPAAPAPDTIVSEPDGLPSCVDLPPLNRQTVGHDEPLFEVPPPADTDCLVSLVNHERKATDRTSFDLHPLDESGRVLAWQVDLVTGINSKSQLNDNVQESRVPVALFGWGDAFQFRWLSGADTLAAAEGLRSCVLVIETAGQKQAIALRNPLKIEPIAIDLDHVIKPVPITGSGLPDNDLWETSLVHVEGLSPTRAGAGSPMYDETIQGMKGAIRVPIGGADTGAEIMLKLVELRGEIALRVVAQYKDIDNKMIPLTNERIATLKRTLPRELEQAQASLATVQAGQTQCANQLQVAQAALNRDASNEQARVVAIDSQAQLEHLAGQAKSLMKRIPLLQQRMNRVALLAKGANSVHGKVRLYVRVVCHAGEHEVELLTTE